MSAVPASRPDRETLFREAVERFGPALQRLVRGYEAEPAKQEELRQEIGLQLWRALRGFRGDAALRTFVFRVAHNTAIKHVRSAVREPAEAAWSTPPEPSTDSGVDAAIDRARAREAMTAAIRTLPALDREVVLLHFEGLSNTEVADVTGLSASNVGTRLTRIRTRLSRAVGGAR